MSLNNAQKIFNLIRLKASKEYQDTVPALTDKSPIGDVGTPILSNPLVFKEFSSILGSIFRVEVLKRAWSNPLSELIRETGSPLGEYSMEIANNPVSPRQYDPTRPEKVLEYAMLDDKVAYYARNVKEVFKVSIAYQDMQGAFASYDKFNDYVSMKMASLTSGQQISQFNHIFESIVANYNAGLFVKSPLHIGKGYKNYADFTTEVKNIIDLMQYPNFDFNRYGELAGANGKFRGWCNLDDIIVLARIDWVNETTVNFLSTLFNLDKAEIGKRIIKVPDFGYDLYDEDGTMLDHVSTPIQAMVCDKKLFNFSTDLEIDDSWYNAETLVQNHYKHWWATYSCSPFAQCVVFTDEATNDFEYEVNNFKVKYNYPADLTLKNISGTSKSVTSSIDKSNISIHASNGDKINVKTFDYDENTVIEDIDEFATILLAVALDSTAESSMPAGFIAVHDSSTDSTASIKQYSNTTATVTDGTVYDISVLRTNLRNYLVPQTLEISDVVLTIPQDTVNEFIRTYGNDCYIKIPHSFTTGSGESAQTFTNDVYIGLKNKAVIGVI